jgi:AcrR family transcriptional regulator
MAEPSTRDRLVGATADLFRVGGFHATSVKAIVERAEAPFGSMYHHFPGGKDELGAAAISASGRAYGDLIDLFFGDDVTDLADATEAFFVGAAWTLTETDYADACPIATVALEVASTNERLRTAASAAFDDWVGRATTRFIQHGISPEDAPGLARVVIMLLEGAFLLCRTGRTTEPMADAQRVAVAEVRRRLQHEHRPSAN